MERSEFKAIFTQEVSCVLTIFCWININSMLFAFSSGGGAANLEVRIFFRCVLSYSQKVHDRFVH